jgi:hypothetical protein
MDPAELDLTYWVLSCNVLGIGNCYVKDGRGKGVTADVEEGSGCSFES